MPPSSSVQKRPNTLRKAFKPSEVLKPSEGSLEQLKQWTQDPNGRWSQSDVPRSPRVAKSSNRATKQSPSLESEAIPMVSISHNRSNQDTGNPKIQDLVHTFEQWQLATSFQIQSLAPRSPRTQQAPLSVSSQSASNDSDESLTNMPVMSGPPPKPPRRPWLSAPDSEKQSVSSASEEMPRPQQEEPKEAQTNRTPSLESLNLSDFQEAPKEEGRSDQRGRVGDMIRPTSLSLIEKNLQSVSSASEEMPQPQQEEPKEAQTNRMPSLKSLMKPLNLSDFQEDPKEGGRSDQRGRVGDMIRPTSLSLIEKNLVSKQAKIGKWRRFRSNCNKYWKKIISVFKRRKAIENAAPNRNDPAKNTETIKTHSLELGDPGIKVRINNKIEDEAAVRQREEEGDKRLKRRAKIGAATWEELVPTD